MNVKRVSIDACRTVRAQRCDWTVVTDTGLLARLSTIREEKLPNETGGVLLGSFDVERRIVYVADTIASPPDSDEWPFHYIRGCSGLRAEVEAMCNLTDGMLEYVGEWHSHPHGCGAAPSGDDRRVFSWISDNMALDGLPGVMMIAGDSGRTSCFVCEIGDTESLLSLGKD
jgi:proteasome lid subunit RPN8/RPN11